LESREEKEWQRGGTHTQMKRPFDVDLIEYPFTDHWLPEQMAKWQRYLPMNETEILDDASHYVQEDRPDRVAASIRRVWIRT
jgi:pimeloyl-ACP methyl ester carboxylesterase